ncbi:hypothetical protein HMPREF1394_00872 [Helicobacter pylori GAM105Ai]|nr:hypothetical protein HMPREF1394_00872 [Helicobacter pylori GAM105Ai]
MPLEDWSKTACAHHALKALQAALKDNDLVLMQQSWNRSQKDSSLGAIYGILTRMF